MDRRDDSFTLNCFYDGKGIEGLLSFIKSRIKLIVAFTIAAAIAGCLYGSYFMAKPELSQKAFDVTAAIGVSFEDDGASDSFESADEYYKWVGTVIFSSDSKATISRWLVDQKVLPDFSLEDAERWLDENVTYSFDSSMRILTISCRSDFLDEATAAVSAVSGGIEYVLESSLTPVSMVELSIEVEEQASHHLSAEGIAKQAMYFALFGLMCSIVVVVCLPFVRDYVSFGSLLVRYSLPVFGPYGNRRRQFSSKGLTFRYEGFPADGVYVGCGLLRKASLSDLPPLGVRDSIVDDSVLPAVVSLDEAIRCSRHADDTSVLLVVQEGATTHKEVEVCLRALAAACITPYAFVVVSL